MGLESYKVGKTWEEEVMTYYYNRGYYVYKFPTELNGTICDVLVSRKNNCIYIECKHTKNERLYYKTCGIIKKRDELDNFVNKYKNDVYIMIKSDKSGKFWIKWSKAKPIFENKGYLDLENDCIKFKEDI